MAIVETVKKLVQATLSGATDTAYTVPANTSVIIKTMNIINYSANQRTVKIWHDGTGDHQLILPTVTLDAGDFAEYTGVIFMEAGDTLHVQSSAGTSIAFVVYGVLLTET